MQKWIVYSHAAKISDINGRFAIFVVTKRNGLVCRGLQKSGSGLKRGLKRSFRRLNTHQL